MDANEHRAAAEALEAAAAGTVPAMHKMAEWLRLRANDHRRQAAQLTDSLPGPGPGVSVIYDVARPTAAGRAIVYGGDAWYEFRLIDRAGSVEYDSGKFGEYGMGYGDPAIALRDALIHDTD